MYRPRTRFNSNATTDSNILELEITVSQQPPSQHYKTEICIVSYINDLIGWRPSLITIGSGAGLEGRSTNKITNDRTVCGENGDTCYAD